MNLESKKVSISKSSEYIFNELLNTKNFQKLMPETISKFEVINEKSFEFGLKGLPIIKLEKKNSTPFSEIVLGSISNNLTFKLTVKINQIINDKSEVNLLFNSDFNSMMQMIAKNPITNFMESLVSNMYKL